MAPQKAPHALPGPNKVLWSLHQPWPTLSGSRALPMARTGFACSKAKPEQPRARPAALGNRESHQRIGSWDACTPSWEGTALAQGGGGADPKPEYPECFSILTTKLYH